ncbi:MAG: SDR family NAD(P)-dependent oxidoreductase [Rhodobacteraceae bacterium]|nr:SDR family NAD(P)-dependent oxidoreductase [Paracoccaceae bacterium]
MQQTWIILGATSAIARSFARQMAEDGAGLILAGRDKAELATLANDAALRGARFAEAMAFDTAAPEGFRNILSRAAYEEGALNAAVFTGSMPAQDQIDADTALIEATVIDNYAGPMRFLQMLAPMIEERGRGTIVGVASVAGDRGRLGNYVYGSTKAGFATYLSGLRNRLNRAGGHVVTVKPGMVDTAMTWGLDGLVLLASPDKVAGDIVKAVKKRRNTIYSPAIWMVIMGIIRTIPEPIFKKLKI